MIKIGAKPDSPFTEPIGLMSDCHRRIEKFLAQLLLVTREKAGGELDEASRAGFQTALDYFRGAAPLHTDDEEASLFPRLRLVDGPEVEHAMRKVAALEADHREADRAHAEVDQLGRKWVRDRVLSEAEAGRLLALLEDLQSTYQRHIAVEDNEVFPLAARLLEADSITEIGREMAVRRGLDPDNLPSVSHCQVRKQSLQTTAD